MSADTVIRQPFSNVQLELLKLFASNVTDDDLLEIKILLAKYLFEKAKNGEQLSTSEVDLLIDYMPMSLRAHRGKASDKNGSAGTEIPGDRGTDTNEEFNKYSRPIRAKIIQEWILSGAELDKKNNMIGISAKWDHVKTGVLNKEDGGEGSNKVHNLRGVTLENMKLFTVGSKVSNQIIHKNGDRTIVPIKLRDKTGGIFIEVKDNNGKPFNLRLKTNTLQGTPELDIIMDLIKEIMLGGRMDQIVPSNIMEKLENEIPLLAKVFKKTPRMGVLYNTLVYQGSDTSQVGVALNPATREFSIGPDTCSAAEFLDNIDTIKSMMGLKFRNVNFPSSDIKNNKVPSIANMDYLTYIMETKAVSTEIKENAPIFVGELEETINSNGEKVSNYMSNINPYLTPSNISGTKKVTPAVKKVTTKVVGEAVSLGSRARQKLEKAGYDPAKLSQKAIEFIKSIASKSSKAFIQAIEDYNNTIERESGNTEDHIIKKCRG